MFCKAQKALWSSVKSAPTTKISRLRGVSGFTTLSGRGENTNKRGRRIPKEEGILSLWKGGVPTVVRAMSLNLGMFTTYEESKKAFSKVMGTGMAWFLSSIFAGAVAAIMSLPFDNAKTKMQKMKAGSDGKMPYKNLIDCMAKEIANNGPKGLYVGLPTFVTRIAPHAMIVLLISD